MGLTTLAGFRTRLQTTLGNRGFTDAELDLWINAGLTELTGAIEFEELKTKATVNFVDGTQEYTLASNIAQIVSVSIPDEEWYLVKSTEENIRQLRRDFEYIPRYWALVGLNGMIVHPIPDADYTGEYTYYKEPTLFSASGDTSELPSGFDNSIFMFAVAHAFFDLDEEQKGTLWTNRAAAHAGSRLMREERGSEAESAPVWVPPRDWIQNVGRRDQ